MTRSSATNRTGMREMDIRETKIPVNNRTTSNNQGGRRATSSIPGTGGVFGPGGWSINDDMSAVLAHNWWAVALRGVFAIIFGVIALLLPGAAIGALVLLFAAYMIVDGIFA